MKIELKKRKFNEPAKKLPIKVTETDESTINNIVRNINAVGKTHNDNLMSVGYKKKLKVDL